MKAAHPGAQLGSVTFPERPTDALPISANAKPQGPFTIAVNQYTGQELGVRTAAPREAGLARQIHLLHTRLFAGQIGEWTVGTITFLTLFMAIAGMVLWWPRKIFTVMMSASGRRINFDLHNVFGFYASAVFFFIALTGMMIAFEQWTDPLFRRLDEVPVPALARESTVVPGAPSMSLGALTQAAEAALPGAFLRGITIPNGGKGVVTAMMKYPEDRTPGGRSRVALDQYSGQALTVLNTRALYCITCLMLAGQVVTGVFIWWKRPAPVASRARA